MKFFDFKQNVRRFTPRELPFAFGEKDSPTPPKKRRQVPAADWRVNVGAAKRQALCQHHDYQAQKSGIVLNAVNREYGRVSGCLNVDANRMAALEKDYAAVFNQSVKLNHCAAAVWRAFARLNHDDSVNHHIFERLNRCIEAENSALARLFRDGQTWYTAAELIQKNQSIHWLGKIIQHCQKNTVSASVQPPCEWYPLVLPENPPPSKRRPCGAQPPPNRLPLRLLRRRLEMNQIPLPFSCRPNFLYIPPLDTYVMLNKINAQANGVTLNPLSASVKTDVNGYCWMGEMTLPPDDFAALNLHGQTMGEEVLIRLNINDEIFVFMAENYSDNRRFAQKSYTVSGRSVTAKLGADYAIGRKGVVNQALYARQIADQSIADLGFNIEFWQCADWLIPPQTYVLTDKTPIAVLQDIAGAVGGFVASHPSEPKLTVAPRWQYPAWQINQSNPDVTVPANVILAASGQQQTQTRHNGVFVWGGANGKAADVKREGSSGEPRAAAQHHVLYTDLTACEAAAIAVLSDSGNHKTETVTLPLMPKYNLNRAQLGQIWRFVEPNGAWQGVITGVAISVAISGDVPVVKQTLTVNRYMGD